MNETGVIKLGIPGNEVKAFIDDASHARVGLKLQTPAGGYDSAVAEVEVGYDGTNWYQFDTTNVGSTAVTISADGTTALLDVRGFPWIRLVTETKATSTSPEAQVWISWEKHGFST